MLLVQVLLHLLVDQWEQDLLPMSGYLCLFPSIGLKETCEDIVGVPLEVTMHVVQLIGHFLAPQTPQLDSGLVLVNDNVLEGIPDPRPCSHQKTLVVEPLKSGFQWSIKLWVVPG